MITPAEITDIGHINKTHGIDGELSITFDEYINPIDLTCLVIDIDGIYVPFFVTAARPRGIESWLVLIDGVSSEVMAADFVGKDVFALQKDLADVNDKDTDGFYLNDLLGFRIHDHDGTYIGTVNDIDFSTDNSLFIVTTDNNNSVMIPANADLILSIDPENSQITMNLPSGLINLN